jgi:hypothetical protein
MGFTKKLSNKAFFMVRISHESCMSAGEEKNLNLSSIRLFSRFSSSFLQFLHCYARLKEHCRAKAAAAPLARRVSAKGIKD